MYFILFYRGSHAINYNTENNRTECFAVSKQRDPGRKGLGGDGAVSCGGLAQLLSF